MNYGKLTQSVYERSVVKVVKTNSDKNRKYYNGAGLGTDCAVLASENVNMVSGQAVAYGNDTEAAYRAYMSAVNYMATYGAYEKAFANIIIMVPERLREIKIRNMLELVSIKADELDIPVMSANVQVMSNVTEPIVNCVVNAYMKSDAKCQQARPKEDIVMTKWMGLEGTAVIANQYSENLKSRYHADIVEEAKDFKQYMSVLPEIAIALNNGASAVQVVREGGIFGGLWNLAETGSVGLEVSLKDIPVKQETIEVCEYYDVNPYELLGGGSLLISTSNGTEMVRLLREQGIESAIIGVTTDNNDRIIKHDEESRYLEPPKGELMHTISET